MAILWLQAILDVPADSFDEASEFWAQRTNSTLGEINPDHPEYVHLNPKGGDRHLEMQRIDEGPPGAHLDLVVEDIAGVTNAAIEAGASLVGHHEQGHAVLTTPGGVVFCVVPWSGEKQRATPIDPRLPHAVDQICLDVPHDYFEADIAFWSALTGWDVNAPNVPEFRSFDQPESLPLRILIQQLGKDDTGGARAHLDMSCGEHVGELTRVHAAAGASVLDEHKFWTILEDPVGQQYCLTARKPATP